MKRHAALLLILSAFLLTASAGAEEQPKLGELAPVFELPSTRGDSVSLADLRGKTVVLHFGAGW